VQTPGFAPIRDGLFLPLHRSTGRCRRLPRRVGRHDQRTEGDQGHAVVAGGDLKSRGGWRRAVKVLKASQDLTDETAVCYGLAKGRGRDPIAESQVNAISWSERYSFRCGGSLSGLPKIVCTTYPTVCCPGGRSSTHPTHIPTIDFNLERGASPRPRVVYARKRVRLRLIKSAGFGCRGVIRGGDRLPRWLRTRCNCKSSPNGSVFEDRHDYPSS
jgi:hypothetical protein